MPQVDSSSLEVSLLAQVGSSNKKLPETMWYLQSFVDSLIAQSQGHQPLNFNIRKFSLNLSKKFWYSFFFYIRNMYIMKGEKAYKMKYHTLCNYMYNVKNLSLQNIDYFHLMTWL